MLLGSWEGDWESMGISVESPLAPLADVSNGVDLAVNAVEHTRRGKHQNGIRKDLSSNGTAHAPTRKHKRHVEMCEFDDSSSEDEKEEWAIPRVSVGKVDDRDKGTADEWICRHPELVRLTGRHPFNCEPPLPLLMEVSTALHFDFAQVQYVDTLLPTPADVLSAILSLFPDVRWGFSTCSSHECKLCSSCAE